MRLESPNLTVSLAGALLTLDQEVSSLRELSDVVEAPPGDGNSRGAARAGLAALGYSLPEIDRDYIPAMALRNEMDVGHVDLTLLTLEQLETLHRYTRRAEVAFRELLIRVTGRVALGDLTLPIWVEGDPDRRARALLGRLKSALDTLPPDAAA